MLLRIRDFSLCFLGYFKKCSLNSASAALCYYLTMTVFPLLICLYTMLGQSYETLIRMVRLINGLFLPETIRMIEDFLSYVAANNSRAMMLAGLLLLISYASAGVRSLQKTVYTMQGGEKYDGLKQFLFSVAFSLFFLAAIYFAVLVMLTGRRFISFVNDAIPFIDISGAWVVVRFAALAGIFFCVLLGVYESPKRSCDHYSTLPGAVLASIALLLVTLMFSVFISRSGNYPMVYGSLASLILLMLWLYFSCMVIYCGAAVNIVIRDMTHKKEK